jgi:hypothetical protein
VAVIGFAEAVLQLLSAPYSSSHFEMDLAGELTAYIFCTLTAKPCTHGRHSQEFCLYDKVRKPIIL